MQAFRKVKSSDAFADRIDAAERLATRLHEYQGRNPLILAIPRGAVPMASVLAQRLGGELDVVLVHKLGAPFDPEFAIGLTCLPTSKGVSERAP